MHLKKLRHVKQLPINVEVTTILLKDCIIYYLCVAIKIDQYLYLVLIDKSGNHIRGHGRDINKMLCLRLNTLPPLSAIVLTQCIAKNLLFR